MSDTVETVTIKDAKGGPVIINKSDFNEEVHKLHPDNEKPAEPVAAQGDRNPSGTFSEPTPTDIRYPNKDATEFENNHGAFVGKSAAQMRDEKGLPDEPGGIKPKEAARVKQKIEAVEDLVAGDADGSDDADKPAS